MITAINTAYQNPAVENVQARINTLVNQSLDTQQAQIELQELYYQREYLMEQEEEYDPIRGY